MPPSIFFKEGKMGSGSNTIVFMKNICKEFYGFKALDNVSFDLREGEIHVILGENGAGKTTLMKILSGIYKMDSGEIYIDGVRRDINSVGDAIKYGIAMVNQYPQLIDELTIADNISLSLKKLSLFSMSKKLVTRIREISDRYGFKIDPNKLVKDLSFSERQRVEIIKALLLNARIIIMDEPTTLLTSWERRLIYQFMRKAKREGRSVVLITHKLSEALEVADRITVLRRGRVVDTISVEEASYENLMKMMFNKIFTPTKIYGDSREAGREILKVENLVVYDDYGREAVKEANFTVHEGEIVGIAGIAGNGQRELIEAIYGVRRYRRGRIIFLGKEVTDIKDKILKRNIGYIPDKIPEALVLNMPIYENTILKTYDNKFILKKRIFIDYNKAYKYSEELIKKYNIMAENPDVETGTLSGGNLQKLVLAREISLDPVLLIAVNPSKTLDYFSTELLYNTLTKFREGGKSVLLVSEDTEEIMRISDRVLVMHEGRLYDLGYRKDLDIDLVEEYMIHGEVRGVVKVES